MKKYSVIGASVSIFAGILLFSCSHAAFADTSNLFANPSVETPASALNASPQSWATDVWGTTKASFNYISGGAEDGSWYVTTKVTTKGTGDAKWYPAPIPATAGQTYAFSDWYKSGVQSLAVVQYQMADGTYQYADLGTIAKSTSWKQFTTTFKAPAGASTMTVFHFIQAAGTLSVDNYVLMAGSSLPPPTFDFSLSNDGNRTVLQGQSISTSISAALVSGATQPAAFSISTLPTGITASFSQAACSPTCSSTLTLNVGMTAATGTYPITVSDTAGTVVRTTSFDLNVQAPASVPPGNNIVPNPSVENPQPSNANLPVSWQHDKWGSNTATFTYNKNLGHTGTHSVTVAMSAYKTGDAKWDLTAPLSVTPGDTYDYSDWYQSTEISHVAIEFNLTDGTQYYIEMRTAPISANWSKYEQSFQIPYNAASMRVFHMIEGKGSVTIDDISLVKMTPKGFARPLVTLTYDNGFEDNINTAIPMMNAAGIPATYCISTQYVEGIPAQEAIVKQIAADGYEICSHAVDHDSGDMTKETVPQLDFELSHSQSYLQALVNQPIHNFLTPFGAYNDTVVGEIMKYYRAHRTTDEGYNTVENFDKYRLLVQNMEPGTTQAQFQSWLDEAKKTNSWLVLVYHRVATSDLTDYDTPLADFQPQLDALKSSGIAVKTMDQALDEILPQVGQ